MHHSIVQKYTMPHVVVGMHYSVVQNFAVLDVVVFMHHSVMQIYDMSYVVVFMDYSVAHAYSCYAIRCGVHARGQGRAPLAVRNGGAGGRVKPSHAAARIRHRGAHPNTAQMNEGRSGVQIKEGGGGGGADGEGG